MSKSGTDLNLRWVQRHDSIKRPGPPDVPVFSFRTNADSRLNHNSVNYNQLSALPGQRNWTSAFCSRCASSKRCLKHFEFIHLRISQCKLCYAHFFFSRCFHLATNSAERSGQFEFRALTGIILNTEGNVWISSATWIKTNHKIVLPNSKLFFLFWCTTLKWNQQTK